MEDKPPTTEEINQSLYGSKSGRPAHNAHPKSDKEKRTYDGIVFDSMPEVQRWKLLCLRRTVGEIRNLQYHVKFDIIVNDVHICYYTPDFTYIEKVSNAVVVEDTKGWKKTKAGNLVPRKGRGFSTIKNLMKACFGISVVIPPMPEKER